MKMLLSSETRLGIRITGIHTVLIILFMQETLILCFIHVVNSFIELVEYIFNHIPGVTLFLSNAICQDPLEKFFGQQRQRGRTNENPNVFEFIKNTQALRVINSTCSNIRGNCRGQKLGEKRTRAIDTIEIDNAPISKRRYKHK